MSTIRKSHLHDGQTIYHKALYSTVYSDDSESLTLGKHLETISASVSNNAINTANMKTTVDNHISNKSNPHSVTKLQVGLGSVDNTSDVDKNVRSAGRVRDSSNNQDINITYSKAGQSTTSWVASWNGYELGAISPANLANAMNAIRTATSEGYKGFVLPGGSQEDWLRTTKNGIIPYQSGGSSNLGTSSWPFSSIHGWTIYEGGTALSSKYAAYNHSHSGYAAASHTHSYLPLSGGTVTGDVTILPHLYFSSNRITSKPNPPESDAMCGIWLDSQTGGVYLRAGSRAYNNSSYTAARSVFVYAGPASATNHAFVVQRIDQSTYAPAIARSWNTSSSRKVKKNIKPLTPEIADKILDIEVVSFDYKKKHGGDKDCRGVIAEDVFEITPEVVTLGGEDQVTGVDYAKFVPYLIKKVQMMNEEIGQLKADIAQLVAQSRS